MSNRILKLLLFPAALLSLVFLLALLPEKTEKEEISKANHSVPEQAALPLETIPGRTCLGLPVVERETLLQLRETGDAELSKLCYNGERAAVDRNSRTVYISQGDVRAADCESLAGSLSFADASAALCFVNSPQLEDIASCIRDGKTLELAAVSGDCYSTIRLVLTSLPVVRVDGVFQKYGDYVGKDIMGGDLCLWNGEETVSSELLWHYRGYGSINMDKKSIKLSLKKDRSANHHLDLLGMGADDDWMLNAMSMDDLNLREKMAITLWNEGFAREAYNYPMSTGEYVELVLNGRYNGLYLLQRRIDQKYLALDQKEDILFKGRIGYNVMAYLYELKYSPYSENASFTYLDGVRKDMGSHNLNIPNFVDINLFLNYLAADDNTYETNMYYILEQAAESPQMTMVPWDTDVSFGMLLIKRLDYEEAGERVFLRNEYEQLREEIPELDRFMAERWFALREDVFSEENIEKLVYAGRKENTSWDAAMQRDENEWGLFFGGADSLEQYARFCLERIAFLDDYYANTAA